MRDCARPQRLNTFPIVKPHGQQEKDSSEREVYVFIGRQIFPLKTLALLGRDMLLLEKMANQFDSNAKCIYVSVIGEEENFEYTLRGYKSASDRALAGGSDKNVLEKTVTTHSQLQGLH